MAKANSKELANVTEQLAAEAASIADSIGKPSTNQIKVRDKVFTLPDGQIIQAPLQIVIIDFISQNKFYENAYNENNIEAPACFAISKTVSDMAPSENATDPQADDCNSCPMNEFGSDGNGKACKNTRVLAVTLPNVEGDDIYTMSVSPTAIKAFDAYVGSIAKMFKAPPVRVITEAMFHPEKSYPSLMFGNPQPNENYAEDFARRSEAEDLLTVEPEATPAEAPAAKSKVVKKRTVKKKATRRR